MFEFRVEKSIYNRIARARARSRPVARARITMTDRIVANRKSQTLSRRFPYRNIIITNLTLGQYNNNQTVITVKMMTRGRLFHCEGHRPSGLISLESVFFHDRWITFILF